MQKKPLRFFLHYFFIRGRRKEVKTLNGYSYLTLEQRREIERMYAEGERVVDIAARLKRSAAAIYEELKRGYTGEFDATPARSTAPILHKRRCKRISDAEETDAARIAEIRKELFNMKMKRIANNVALQTIGYVISGFTNVYIYVRECGYQKRDIYRGLYKHFAHDEMNKYAYCKITELRADENVLYIGIEE